MPHNLQTSKNKSWINENRSVVSSVPCSILRIVELCLKLDIASN